MNESVLFLTACIDPQGMCKTTIQNRNERLNMYLAAVSYYLKYFSYKILIVENTNTNINEDIAKIDPYGRIEYLTFAGNDYDKSLGKGYGEALIIKYAIENSLLLKDCKYIIKITGRHLVMNLTPIITMLKLKSNSFDLACLVNVKDHFAISDMFVVKKDFLQNYFIPCSDEINDTKGYYLEHALFDAIRIGHKNGAQIISLPLYPCKKGFSGTTGLPFNKPSYWKQFKCLLRFLIIKSSFV